MNREKIEREIDKMNEKLQEYQDRLKKLWEMKQEMENTEYLKIIRKNGISAGELNDLLKQAKKENEELLKQRKKESDSHEEHMENTDTDDSIHHHG